MGKRRRGIRTEIIEGRELALSDWLSRLEGPSHKRLFPNFCFPSEQHRAEYVESVYARSESEVKTLLRRFLIQTGSFPVDGRYFSEHCGTIVRGVAMGTASEYERRLLKARGVWEGITWVLDLLPSYPKRAIETIDAYISAHIQLLPDGRITGLADAQYLIRARYISASIDAESRTKVLLAKGWRDFESLIALLYQKMGYEVELTPPQKDGGRDVIARRRKVGRVERVYIECKLYDDRKVALSAVKQLHSTITDAHGPANRGVLVSTSLFTSGAVQFAARNNLELVCGVPLIELLNEYLGADWPLSIDYIIKVGSERLKRGREQGIEDTQDG